jgi:hypothetical protein
VAFYFGAISSRVVGVFYWESTILMFLNITSMDDRKISMWIDEIGAGKKPQFQTITKT